MDGSSLLLVGTWGTNSSAIREISVSLNGPPWGVTDQFSILYRSSPGTFTARKRIVPLLKSPVASYEKSTISLAIPALPLIHGIELANRMLGPKTSSVAGERRTAWRVEDTIGELAASYLTIAPKDSAITQQNAKK